MNDVIDRTAAAMTSVPHVDITAGVMARLEPRRNASVLPAMLAAAAVAAALLAALEWPRVAPLEPTNVATEIARQVPAREVPETAEDAARTQARAPVRRVAGISAEEAAWRSRAVRPLDVAGAITIEAIQPPRPSIAPITVETFGPLPIDVPAIDVRSSGGR